MYYHTTASVKLCGFQGLACLIVSFSLMVKVSLNVEEQNWDKNTAISYKHTITRSPITVQLVATMARASKAASSVSTYVSTRYRLTLVNIYQLFTNIIRISW